MIPSASLLDEPNLNASIWVALPPRKPSRVGCAIRSCLAIGARNGPPLQDRRAATALVTIWNARRASGRELWFYPTIGAAIVAGRPWLSVMCPACQMIGEVDLRTLGRHPGASIDSLIPALSCRRCQPHPPFVKLLGLSAAKAWE